jgi:hypothetical protein
LAVRVTLVAAVQVMLSLRTPSAAPIAVTDPHSAGPFRGAPPVEKPTTASDAASEQIAAEIGEYTIEATGWREPELRAGDFPTIAPMNGLFGSRESELQISDEKNKPYSDTPVCVHPDARSRMVVGSEDECRMVKSWGIESVILSVPFLALSGWALVILIVAGLYRLYGNWRIYQWLRRARARGIKVRPPRSRVAYRGTGRRTSSRGRTRSRRYAG